MSSPPKDSKDEIPNTKETEKEEAPKPKSEESGDEGEEMVARFVTLAMMPTLRYFYKTKRLQPASEPKDVRYPCKPSLLDRVSLYQGDITKLQVDAIVNAANRSLLGGGGVDGAIHSAAGDELYEECLTLGGADTGEAKITGGHRLPAKHIIHAVGPVYSSSHRDIKAEQLASCYSTSLGLALSNNLTSIAFCSLSTGIYGYPIAAATHIALRTTREFLDNVEKADSIERVIFVVWSDKDKHVYEDLIPLYFPPEEVTDAEPASTAPKDEESAVPMEESQKS